MPDIKSGNIMLTIRDEGILAEFGQAEREHPCPRKVIDDQRTIYSSEKVIIRVKWTPNLALTDAASCTLHTRAKTGGF
jgi:hypothetical protein